MPTTFSYDEAYSRNLGWLSPWEQSLLCNKRVAIAGLGGVGGAHLLSLCRLGVGRFHISDLDQFEVVNFNRQAGGLVRNVGRSKVDAMAEEALQINPTLDIGRFGDGISSKNVDAFLEGVDLYVDGLDTFANAARRLVFARCREKGIWAITAAPLGMSAAYIIFDPKGMSFEEYFGMEHGDEFGNVARLVAGVAPGSKHGSYLQDASRIDLLNRKVPSLGAGAQLCAGVVASEALKILLERGRVRAAPYYQQFDAYTGRFEEGKIRGGAKNLVQRTKQALLKNAARRISSTPPTPIDAIAKTRMERILTTARWAPSGDNDQPWRFEVIDDQRVRVHLHLPTDDVYDLDGVGTLTSGGCLVETIRIAALSEGQQIEWSASIGHGHEVLIDVTFSDSEGAAQDPRESFVRVRSVDRQPYKLRPLSSADEKAIEDALGPDLEVRFFRSIPERMKVVSLNALVTDIKMRLPETHELHKRIVDFDQQVSPDRIPSTALGLSRFSQKAMQWAMKSPERNKKLVSLLGTGMNQLEFEFVPGLACAAQILVSFRNPAHGRDLNARVEAGARIQRMWLEITRRGLCLQPGYIPLAFSRYLEDGRRLSVDHSQCDRLPEVAQKLSELWPRKAPHDLVFAARLGTPTSRSKLSRSSRLPLAELIVDGDSKSTAPIRKSPDSPSEESPLSAFGSFMASMPPAAQ